MDIKEILIYGFGFASVILFFIFLLKDTKTDN